MGKVAHKKVFPVVFLALLLLIFIMELHNSIQQVKQEYLEKQIEKNDEYEVKITEDKKGINDPDEHKNNTDLWVPIERKDSYNNELQYYCKDNVVIEGDTIEIISKKENKEEKMYTSGLVESTSSYKYGYFEFTIQISEGKGVFPAIWLLPVDGDPLPEIDIFEMIGNEPHIFYGVVHYEENGIKASDYFAHEVPVKDRYPVALNWTDEILTWHIDSQEIYSTTKAVPQEYMYIIINQAIGGDWPGNPDDDTVLPNYFKVLSMRIEPLYMRGRD